MAEPTCVEIDEYLSRKLDGWEPCTKEDHDAGICHATMTAYCGPSAAPILGLIEKQGIVLSLEYRPVLKDWLAEVWLSAEVLMPEKYAVVMAEAAARVQSAEACRRI